MSQRLHTAIVELERDTLIYRFGWRQEAESAPPLGKGAKKVDLHEVAGLAAQITRALGSCDVSTLEHLGERLYNCVIPDELTVALSPEEAQDNLVFYLDPEISWIPWELLFDGTSFLCRRFRVARSLLKSGAELEAARRRAARSSRGKVLVLLGDVSRLAVDDEIESIQSILLPRVGNDHFDIRSAESKSDALAFLTKDYDICHFIGHGVFSREYPEDSGWRFRRGDVLTCAQIRQISSPGAIFPRLIVANSCDSARSGDAGAEAYVSTLYRSFLARGVPHYIGTIARVPDNVSRMFSQSFYAQVACGKSIGESLLAAREAASAGIGWAFYVHYGDPGLPLMAPCSDQPRQKTSPPTPPAAARTASCSNCGSPIQDDAAFCDSCGTPLGHFSAAPPATAAPAMEKKFYESPGILVTNSRFVVDNRTFTMSGVTSVRSFTEFPSYRGPIIAMVAGLVVLLAGLSQGSQGIGPIAIGVLIVAAGMWRYSQRKAVSYVVLRSASGEQAPLRSEDQNVIDEVINALNESIVSRG